ncbi:tetratricopeptide repeat protein [Bordetella genomosp. 13]|uniref:capsular polysaccharide export protein, LipB/KpsS family n=1 Tax=Bordetella genomosp. 13 TaxID=463040 RepID=UPI001642893E|nr:tetratricopeptide repeat protein [Bordetella genomosp. 13]
MKIHAADALHGMAEKLFFRRKGLRKSLARTLARRDRVFFGKKKPPVADYRFSLVDPFEVFGEKARFGDFFLVGDNWRNGTDKPVAILWGFNSWKWGFVADYLADYRVAFAPRKVSMLMALLAIRRFPVKADCFVVWGYTEPGIVTRHARWKRIPIHRMEDGFIRSSELGASHSTPYSLVLDDKGLHYNPDTESRLEAILNTKQFTDAERAAARGCIDLMLQLSLSKYTPGKLQKVSTPSIRLQRRVAIVGQVDNDMSMRMGNPEGWSMMDMIRLAKIEHPDAEIVYRPHPEVYEGYQRSRFVKRLVSRICVIESPDVPTAEFLDSVDHVYTVTSLTGFEALLRGKKVTVMGAAFYAGWGLTDDRVAFPRRRARHDLEALFHAIYLDYPIYLSHPANAELGFHTACLRIDADAAVGRYKQARIKRAGPPEDQALVAQTSYWPGLVFQGDGDALAAAIPRIDWLRFFSNAPGRIFQALVLHAIGGKLKTDAARDVFAARVRQLVEPDIFLKFLLGWRDVSPSSVIVKHVAWVLSQRLEDDIAAQTLLNRLNRLADWQRNGAGPAQQPSDAQSADGEQAPPPASFEKGYVMDDEQYLVLSEILDLHVKNKDYPKALDAIYKVAISGYASSGLMMKAARIAEACFDIRSARALALFCQRADLFGENRKSISTYLANLPTDIAEYSELGLKRDVALAISLNPERINDAFSLNHKYLADSEFMDEVAIGWLRLDNEHSVQKAIAYLEIGEPRRAMGILEEIVREGGEDDKLRVAYAKAQADLGNYTGALDTLNRARQVYPSEGNYKEYLRLLNFFGDFEQARRVLSDAQSLQLDVGDAFSMPVLLAEGQIEAAYRAYLNVPFRETMIRYFRDKYWLSEDVEELRNFLILAVYGPGDEIRFASLYPDFQRRFGDRGFRISCDYRLAPIFSRSFPEIEFVPIKRVRGFSKTYPRSFYDKLPGSDLCVVLDNDTLPAIEAANHIVMATDLIWHFRKSYDAFPTRPYLVADESLRATYRARMPEATLRVGICWRSSLTTRARNVNYLDVEELAPLFEIPGIQFVSLQYDDCEEELAWLRERFPGRITDFNEVDQYNDFDSVAAIMTNLDLVIAPATSVAEFAAALGCATWLFASSAEIDWRKRDEAGVDVWHACATIIGGEGGDRKAAMVRTMARRLREFAQMRRHPELELEKIA